jgi:hypothetical protein
VETEWNNGGVTFTGIKLDASATAAAADSLLVDFQESGGSMWSLGITGDVQVAANRYERAVKWLQTADATTQTLAEFTLPVDSSYMVVADVAGKRIDGTNTGRVMYRLRAGVYRESAGAATLQGGVQTPTTKTGGGVGAYTVNIDVTGNNFRVRVSGDTGHTVKWTAVVRMTKAF